MADGPVITCPNCGRKNRVPAAASGTPRCGNCHRPLPWIVDAGDNNFAEIAEQASVPVVVDLWAPWCGPCRMVSPVLADLAAEFAGRMKLVKVNVDESPRLQSRFGVQSIPTLLLLSGGQIKATQIGAPPPPRAAVLARAGAQQCGGRKRLSTAGEPSPGRYVRLAARRQYVKCRPTTGAVSLRAEAGRPPQLAAVAALAVRRPVCDYLGIGREPDGKLVFFEVPGRELSVRTLSIEDTVADVPAHGRGPACDQGWDLAGGDRVVVRLAGPIPSSARPGCKARTPAAQVGETSRLIRSVIPPDGEAPAAAGACRMGIEHPHAGDLADADVDEPKAVPDPNLVCAQHDQRTESREHHNAEREFNAAHDQPDPHRAGDGGDKDR